METEIRIIANLNKEQLDVLLQEIKNTAEIIDVKLKVESNKLIEKSTIKPICYCAKCTDINGQNIGNMYVCPNCGRSVD